MEFSVHVQQTQKEELTDLPPPPGKQSQLVSWNLTNSDVFKENKLHLQQLLKHIVNKTQIEEIFLKIEQILANFSFCYSYIYANLSLFSKIHSF